MLLIFLTFLLTTAGYGALLWWACRRISRHLRGNPEAVKAVTEHVLIPLLGRRAVEENDNTADEPERP